MSNAIKWKNHLPALGLFLLAIVLYLIGWVAAAKVFGALGFVVEMIAWGVLLSSEREQHPEKD